MGAILNLVIALQDEMQEIKDAIKRDEADSPEENPRVTSDSLDYKPRN